MTKKTTNLIIDTFCKNFKNHSTLCDILKRVSKELNISYIDVYLTLTKNNIF